MKSWSWILGRFGWRYGYKWDRLRCNGETVATTQGTWKPVILGLFFRVNDDSSSLYPVTSKGVLKFRKRH